MQITTSIHVTSELKTATEAPVSPDGRRARAPEAPGALPAAFVSPAKPFPRAELAAASPAARTHAEPRNAREGMCVWSGASARARCAVYPARRARRGPPARSQPARPRPQTNQR